jgi:hypothetical protein
MATMTMISSAVVLGNQPPTINSTDNWVFNNAVNCITEAIIITGLGYTDNEQDAPENVKFINIQSLPGTFYHKNRAVTGGNAIPIEDILDCSLFWYDVFPNAPPASFTLQISDVGSSLYSNISVVTITDN